MFSVADVWNQALGLIGNEGEVQEPDTDTDAPATACRRFWAVVRDQVLRDFDWPKLKVTETLQIVQSKPNGGVEWQYAYRYAAKALKLRRLGSTRVDTPENVTPYDLGRDASGALIFTDLENAQVEYTYHETETQV